MNILITNDDGYYSPGITALADALSVDNKVFVIAPEGNRSGKGMSVHISVPLEYKKVGEGRYTCSGNPVDCIVAGTKANILDAKIDLVISGINKGPNLGTDIMYSGTCSAAKQATLFGIPAVAVSLNITGDKDWDDDSNWDYGPLASFIAGNLKELAALTRPSIIGEDVCYDTGIFVNINAFDPEHYKGVKQTTCCFMKHDGQAELDITEDNKGDFTSVFWGVSSKACRREGSDYQACKDGYISISRVVVDPTTEPVDMSNITWRL